MNSKQRTPLHRFAAYGMSVWVGIATPLVQAAGMLPVPCAGGVCGTNPNPTPWIGQGSGSLSVTPDGSHMVIQQNTGKAIFNWAGFNIGAGNSVQFVQPNAAASVLNRIWDANPTTIQGQLSANGQIFLLNQNGILFAAGAQVDTRSLVASSLDINDNVYLNGLIANLNSNPQFAPFSGASVAGFVRVEAGATLTTGSGGSVMLFAPTVENNGVIHTPDGQILLAAGSKVYLAPSGDPNLRGLLVAVDNPGTSAAAPGTSTASNLDLGQLIAERGNVTLAGLAVNQKGRITATTSVSTNGSVYLKAGDTAQFNASLSNPYPVTRGGTLVLGAKSVTEVLPDDDDTQTIVDSANMNVSKVNALAQNIVMEGDGTSGALIRAPGGDVTLSARRLDGTSTGIGDYTSTALPDNLKSYPNPPANTAAKAGTRIEMQAGSRIDVSGMSDVELAMERNVLQVQLRGDELKDAPLQRDGFLRGKTVAVDIRDLDENGRIPLADLSGYKNQIARTAKERLTTGGNVKLQSEGDVVIRSGASIDVSGGSVRYRDGYVYTSQLVSQSGKTYDISEAPVDEVYVGFANEKLISGDKWLDDQSIKAMGKFEAGYVEGKDAGTVQIVAHDLSLSAGVLHGATTAGPYQRNAASRPRGGQLILGDTSYQVALDGQKEYDFKLPGITFYSGGTPGTDGNVWISTDLFDAGFDRLAVYSNGTITVPVGTSLATLSGGSLYLGSTKRIDVQGNLITPGGAITLKTFQPFSGLDGDVTLGAHTLLSAAGTWTNDSLPDADRSAAAQADAGSISIEGYGDLDLATGSVLDVSGGAWVKQDGSVEKGNAGSISLAVKSLDASQTASNRITLGSELRGFALGKGGSLKIRAAKALIGNSGTSLPSGWGAETLVLDPGVFTRGGFTDYSVEGYDALTVAANTLIRPDYAGWQLKNSALAQSSGSSMKDLANEVVLPWQLRAPMKLALKSGNNFANSGGVQFGRLAVGAGAVIDVGPQGSIDLSAGNLLTVDGSLTAAAGSISLALAQVGDWYRDNRAIWVGSHARLDVSGIAKLLPSTTGLREGEVLQGGTISLSAGTGTLEGRNYTGAGNVVIQARTDGQATLDVSGTKATLDLATQAGNATTVKATEVASDAGSVVITATEGILLDDGVMAGKSGGDGAAGGRFSAAIWKDRSAGTPGRGYPTLYGDRQMILSQTGDYVPAGLTPGAAIDHAVYGGKAYIPVGGLVSGGFDSVAFKSENQIAFSGPVNLGVKRQITLDAPALAGGTGDVSLSAAYVRAGNLDPLFQSNVPTATSGTAHLDVAAKMLDLEGNFALKGFRSAAFEADQDIRFNAVAISGTPTYTGSLSAAGNLVFKSAQAYPTTLSTFKVSTPGDVTFTGNGQAAPLPLSAGGRLSVEAANIFQNGVLRAPLGSLSLTAGNTIRLGDGSLTSVLAAGALLPLGQTTSDGSEWVYQLDNYTLILDAPPEKAIRLDAPDIQVGATAGLDLSGGGDLYAYEFLPGPGGSRDILAEPGVYAVIPGYDAGYAPRDIQNSDSTLQAGASIYLSGGGGLSAGVYTLLPAHYALMPGAYLVKAVSGYQDMLPRQNRALTDGAALVAGRAQVSGTDIAAGRSQGYLVASGDVVRAYSSFIESRANAFFTQAAQDAGSARPRLPEDAGLLSLRATQLTMNAAPRFDVGAGGRGGMLDIASSAIAIVDDVAGVPSAYLGLSAEMLNSFNVESLLIGGTRSVSASGYDVDVNAADVRLLNSADHVLKAGEVMLASRDTLTLGSGTSDGRDGYIESQGALTDAPGEITLNGDGAFLRVAQSSLPILSRGTTTGSAGTLTLHEGAKLTGDSILLDATRDNLIASTAVFNSPAISVASSRVSFGAVPVGQDGLKVTSGLLAQLRQARDLRLRTYSTMDFYDGASVDLTEGATAPAGLTLDAPALVVHTDEDVVFQANSLALGNTSGPYSGSAAPMSGSLSLRAERYVDAAGTVAKGTGRITMGDGQVALQGGRAYALAASDGIMTSGKGRLDASGDLTLETPHLVADTGTVYDIQSNAALNVVRSTTPNPAAPADTLGGRLGLKGDTVYVDTQIDALAGHIDIEATGGAAGADNLVLANGAQVNAAGYAKAFGTETAYADGGQIELRATRGNVALDNGARVSVAGAGEGDAGSLTIRAIDGTAKLDGDLDGGADTAHGALGGRFALDLAGLGDFSGLLSKLGAGKFSESVSVHLRGSGTAGSIAMAAGDTLTSHDVLLVSDQGDIRLAGVIDSTGARGGSVQAYAADDVALLSGAQLNAYATRSEAQYAGSSGDGGKVTLGTVGGHIDIQSGSAIDVSAHGSFAEGGNVVLRAPRNSAGTDMAIVRLDGSIMGANEVVAEGFESYARNSLSASDVAVNSAIYNDANAFMANAATIAARLGKTGDPAFHVRPGVEVDSTGDLTLNGDLGLQALHIAGESGVLSLRAVGDLILNGSISDGFNGTTASATQNGGDSWSYRLASGADAGSSNPLAVRDKADLAGKGNFTLAAGKMVRTGTGDIDIAVGGDLTLKSTSATQVAVIYTAGVPVDTTGYAIPSGTPKAVFPDRGGDLAIQVGGDVTAEVSGTSNKNQQQLITDWLARKVNAGSTFWWPDFSAFRQGVGALGGGNVRIAAGGDIVNLGTVVPVSGKTNTTSGAMDVRGGGDLTVVAGGDIRGGVFQVGSGQGRIQAGGAIREGRTVSGVPIYPYLALEQGGYDVSAHGNVTIASVFDPTALYRTGFSGTPYFYDYAPGSKVGVQSLVGDVRFDNNNSNLTLLKNAFFPTFTAGGVTALSGYPGQVAAAALSGGIAIANNMVLFPDAQGNLQLLAQKGITLEQGSEVYLSDFDPALIPGALNAGTSTVGLDQYQQFSASISKHATPLLHGADSRSAYLYSLMGDVDLAGYFVSTKQTTIDAGRDIVFRSIAYVQNNADDHQSSFRAGRDIVSPSVRNVTNGLASNNAELQVGGPGYGEFFAGRNIDLGNSAGISSYGNLKNQALPTGGATLSAAAGLGQDGDGHVRDPDYAGFAARYLMSGSAALADYKAPADFSSLSLAQQALLVFNNELLIGASEGQAGKGYERAYAAIATLFPSQDAAGVPLAYQGDVNLVFSRITTQQTGAIQLLMPGGSLNVGLANPPPSLADNKAPSDLGIMTFAGGNILAMARDDIQVNQSRVLTVAGGDILLWSTLGNVDAGKGKKTATAAPPPQVTYDASGNPTLNVQGTVSGSGIGTLKTNPNIPDGNVVLAAPSGVVDAGDAGIRSSGNLLIAAQQVLNSGNIQVGGNVVGTPASSSGLGAGLSGLGNLSPNGQSAEETNRSMRDGSANSAEQMQKVQDALANFKPSLISVEVLGFGGEAERCPDGDIACAKKKGGS
ncbi:filamentous haemagglutinin family protein [Thiobacillus thioparus]|uniref:filamentous haemagglutinin family protein n=1 Tax=Thiobacillus thioparus TaxID=931 RepID=UPI0009DAE077|nr:filamentous haemagglutinin family protein [Thiobacillus thioparus]